MVTSNTNALRDLVKWRLTEQVSLPFLPFLSAGGISQDNCIPLRLTTKISYLQKRLDGLVLVFHQFKLIEANSYSNYYCHVLTLLLIRYQNGYIVFLKTLVMHTS